jgi:hypothetical protein
MKMRPSLPSSSPDKTRRAQGGDYATCFAHLTGALPIFESATTLNDYSFIPQLLLLKHTKNLMKIINKSKGAASFLAFLLNWQ